MRSHNHYINCGAAVGAVNQTTKIRRLSFLLKGGRQTDAEREERIFLPFLRYAIRSAAVVCLSVLPWDLDRRAFPESDTGTVWTAKVPISFLQAGGWHGAQRDAATWLGRVNLETPAAPSAGSLSERFPVVVCRVEEGL